MLLRILDRLLDLLDRPHRSWPTAWSVAGRGILVAVGLGVLGYALVGAAGPYRETRAFHALATCPQAADGCFADEPGLITGRRTWVTTSTSTDANGHTTTTRTTHYEVTWRRADGSQQTRQVAGGFYERVAENRPVTLKVWRGEVVGVTAPGAEAWFPPSVAAVLWLWLLLAHLGIGVALWGLFFGWWDGLFMLCFRSFAWAFAGLVLTAPTAYVLAFGLRVGTGGVWTVVAGVFAVVVAGALVVGSLEEW